MLGLHFDKFDSVRLLDSSSSGDVSIPNTLLAIKNNNITFINSEVPSWARQIIDEIVRKITSN